MSEEIREQIKKIIREQLDIMGDFIQDDPETTTKLNFNGGNNASFT